MKTAIVTLLITPILAISPAKLHATEVGASTHRNSAAKVKGKKGPKPIVRKKARGRAVARIVNPFRLWIDAGKARLSKRTRATRRINAKGSLIFDLQ